MSSATKIPADLIDRARDGDESALRDLLEAVRPRLQRFSMSMCKHREDAEDVMQNAMLAMTRSIGDFRGDASFSTWLFTIVRSHCMKMRRKSKFAPKHEESLDRLDESEIERLCSAIATPFAQMELNESWALVHDALQGLDTCNREILVLKDIEGFRTKEIADIVELSESAVKSRLHRARKQLEEELANRGASAELIDTELERMFRQAMTANAAPS